MAMANTASKPLTMLTALIKATVLKDKVLTLWEPGVQRSSATLALAHALALLLANSADRANNLDTI